VLWCMQPRARDPLSDHWAKAGLAGPHVGRGGAGQASLAGKVSAQPPSMNQPPLLRASRAMKLAPDVIVIGS
jgi:hypothetical protein